MKQLLNSEQIASIVDQISDAILSQLGHQSNLAVIGVRSRGEIFARRICERLSEKLGVEVACGVLDITLYRDDLNSPDRDFQPEVRTTEIGFDISDRTIILVDDVLYTGRSTRAAMDALMDFGRPRAIRLAVLVDRVGRELPIQADFAGVRTDIAPGKLVQVNFIECDGKDEVIIEKG